MSQRQAVTKKKAFAYRAANRPGKSRILDELVELTGWRRDYARAALRGAVVVKVVRPRPGRVRVYGPDLQPALVRCWAVLRFPAGKLLVPMLPVLVPMLRRDGDLELTDAQAELLVGMSAATIDRRLAPERAKLLRRGCSHTKPGTLLKSQIPLRTWAEWDDAVPGFVEIDLVGHEGGHNFGEFCFTLTVTDIATGWTVNRSVRNKSASRVLEAIEHVIGAFPFPVRGIDSDNGSEFINKYLFAFCQEQGITFTRSRPFHKNDGAHVEQKNWARVRELVGYHRYDTAAELEALNAIWAVDAVFTNYLLPQQKLVSKVRHGAKVSKKHDVPSTPHQRAVRFPGVSASSVMAMNAVFAGVRPAGLSREVLGLTKALEELNLAKKQVALRAVNRAWASTP